MDLENSIVECIRRGGPQTFIEIAQKIGKDSIIVSGVLETLAASKKLIKSRYREGSHSIFFLPEQKERFVKRVENGLPESVKKLAERLLKEKILLQKELTIQEKNDLLRIGDLISSYSFYLDGNQYTVWASKDEDPASVKEKLFEKIGKPLEKKGVAPINEIIYELGNSRGVDGVMLTNLEGGTIASVISNGINPNMLSATTASLAGSAQSAIKQLLGSDSFDELSIKCGCKDIICKKTPKFLLVVILSQASEKGMVLMKMDSAIDKIMEELS